MRSRKTQPNSLETDCKNRDFPTNHPKHVFRAVKVKAAYFPTEKQTAISSQLRTLLKRVAVNKMWKKFRPMQNLNPWPLRYRCSALPSELTRQLGAGPRFGPNKPSKWWMMILDIKIHIFAMPSRNEIKRSLHKTKHVVGKIKRQKRSSGTKKGKGCCQNHNAENSVT